MEEIKKLDFRCPSCGCDELTIWVEGVIIKQRVEAIYSNGSVGYAELDPDSIEIEDYNWEWWESQEKGYVPQTCHYSCRQCHKSLGSFISGEDVAEGMDAQGWIVIEED